MRKLLGLYNGLQEFQASFPLDYLLIDFLGVENSAISLYDYIWNVALSISHAHILWVYEG